MRPSVFFEIGIPLRSLRTRVALQNQHEEVLQAVLEPIRSRRALFARDPAPVLAIIRFGSERAHGPAASVLSDVRKLFFLNDDG